MNPSQSIDDVVATMDVLDSWDDRYAYLMELGDELRLMEDSYKSEIHIVSGCVSQVWICMTESSTPENMSFLVDSDALIVKGLLSILMKAVDGKSAHEILQTDLQAIFDSIGLSSKLSPNRRNGLASVIARIREMATVSQRVAG